MADWTPHNQVTYTGWEEGSDLFTNTLDANYEEYQTSAYYAAGKSYSEYLEYILTRDWGEWWHDTDRLRYNIGLYNYPYVYDLYEAHLAAESSGDTGTTDSETGSTSGTLYLNESPTYAWGKIGTVWNCIGQPVPVLYGKHRVGGRVIQNFTRKDGADDYLFLLLLLSEGEVNSISEIKVNNVDISQYTGIEYWTRTGTASQTTIDYFKDIVLQNYVPGLQSLTTTSIDYDVVNSNTDKVIIRFEFPNGLYKQNPDGSYEAASVYIIIDGNTYTVTETKSLGFYYDIHIDSPSSSIAIRRANDETNGPTEDGGALYDKVRLFSVQEIQYSTENYANLAILGMKIKATDDLNGTMPEVSALVEGLKITNLETSTTEFSTNPAYILYDIITNTRYGAGEYVSTSSIDTDAFISAANYYDTLVADGDGGTEKRFEFNIVIDKFFRLTDFLQSLTEMCNSLLLWYNQKIRLIPKQELTTPVQLFTEGNIKANTISWAQTPKNTKYKSGVISFYNSEADYEEYTITVPFASSTETKPEIRKTLVGLTKQSQAIRYARYVLRNSNYRDMNVSFEAMSDSINCEPGDLIYVGHKAQGQLKTGNINTYGNDYIVLDNSYSFTASENYDISIILENDTVETIPIIPFSADIDTNIVHISTTFSALGYNPKSKSQYSLGTSGNSIEKYTITQITKKTDTTTEIHALKYSDDVYYNINDFTISDYTTYAAKVQKTFPDSVENLTLKEQNIQKSDGSYQTNLLIAFSKPEDSYNWDGAFLYFYSNYSDYPDSYVYLAKSNGYYVYDNVPVGNTIAIRAQSVSIDGIREPFGNASIATKIIEGFHKVPDNVQNFSAIQQGDSVVLKWDMNTDIVSKYYEIRKGTSWEGGQVLSTNITTNEYRDFDIYNGTIKYYIKAKTNTGLYSLTATSAVVNVSGIPLNNIIYDNEEAPDWPGIRNGFKRIYDSATGNYFLRSAHRDYTWDQVWRGSDTWADRLDSNETWYEFKSPISYTTDPYDIGKKWLCKLYLSSDIDYFLNNGKWTDYYSAGDTWREAFDADNERWVRIERPANVIIYVSFSDDMTTWSDWEEFTPGQYEFRGVKFKYEFVQNNINNFVEVNNIYQVFDVDDVIVRIPNYSIDASGSTVVFSNYTDTKGRPVEFLHIPYFIGIQILDTSKLLAPIVANKTTTSMDIYAYNSSDTAESCIADLLIHGY